jgi:putative hemolysin
MALRHDPIFETRLASGEDELRAAQRLRYDVFVRELGGDGAAVDHKAGLERDAFDPFFDHLLLFDHARSDEQVVGVYRLLRSDMRDRVGRFYSEDEYDLTPLLNSGRKLLELGRSCVHADYRGGLAMYQLWQGLAGYVTDHQIEVLFGVASFHGTDVEALAEPLSYLYDTHLAPAELRPKAKDYQSMSLIDADQIDRPRAMRATPSLIKAYLRLGGMVGDGAFVDHAFNTVDVCLVMDTGKMSQKHREIYTKARSS